MSSDSPRHILFIVGMHRSGTSALCAALNAAGASFGDTLLAAMDGVNEAGFWEDEVFVDINERLLESAGLHWYSLPPKTLPDWAEAGSDALREEARMLLQRGFGEGPLEAVKDPRLCLTLPFWLSLCDELKLQSSHCIIRRAPSEVAASLQSRDGFPTGYGMRLSLAYQGNLESTASQAIIDFSYDELLAGSRDIVARLQAVGLPLTVESTLEDTVRLDLRHQRCAESTSPLDDAAAPLAKQRAEFENLFPADVLMSDLAGCLVERGRELTEIGELHSAALATLSERDADVGQLAQELREAIDTIAERDEQITGLDERLAAAGQHLSAALTTVDERDGQIVELDKRLHEEGRMHGEALAHIARRDEQLKQVFATPGVGALFRLMWSRVQD